MSFFFSEVAKAPAAPRAKPQPRGGAIPIHSMRKLGCSVCPRDGDRELRSPKLAPDGDSRAEVYLLGAQPTEDDDREGQHWSDPVGREVARLFGRAFMDRHVRSNYVTQCAGEQTVREVECCRGRVVADIEATRPLLVVTVGDAALYWATGIQGGGVMPHRGTLFAARIGNHDCYVFPLAAPLYVNKKSYGVSPHQQTIEHDVARVKAMLKAREMGRPSVAEKPYDRGVEIITGQEPGDMQRLERALEELAATREKQALDIETNCLRPFMHRRPLILTAAVGTFDRTVAFSLDHPDGWGSGHQRQRARAAFYRYLLDSPPKACHNLGFEMEWLVADGGEYVLRRTGWDDTMASAHTLDERPGTKALGTQTRIHFGFDLKEQSRVDPERILDYPLREVLRYNGMDTKWCNAVRDAHAPLIDAEPKFRELYEEKVDLSATLVLTTARGLPVDPDFPKEASARMAAELEEIEKRLRRDPDIVAYSRKHGIFSATAPEHMLQLLKDLGRPEIKIEDKRAGTVKYSTDVEVLQSIGGAVPACGLVLEHRGVSKNKGTYIDPVASGKNVCPDGYIRSKYNSLLVVTDRLSADDPAVQNWPKRKHKWVRAMVSVKRVEQEYLRRRGAHMPHWFAALDYGQIEFRVVGMASEDPNLVKYCWTGYDVHKAWAQRLMEVYPGVVDWVLSEFDEDISAQRAKDGKEFDEDKVILKTLRQEMKNKWVFPQLFGSSTHSCAQALHLPDWVAEDLGSEFWDEFRVVKKWQDRVLRGYAEKNYVETLTGARRRGAVTKEEAINMPIQGTAAAIVKRAMTALSVEAELRGDDELQPRLNVHDDLSTILCDDTLEEKLDTIAGIMCQHRFDFINVPLVVEASVGPNWADLKEVKVYRSDALFNLRNPYA